MHIQLHFGPVIPKNQKFIRVISILLVICYLLPTLAVAQPPDPWDNSSEINDLYQFQDEEDLPDEEMMFDEEGFDGEDSSFFGDPESADDQYLDDSLIPDGAEKDLELELLRQKQLLLEEKINAPLNVAFGAGTGLMIGGWLALLSARNSRDTLRSIGLGVVVGGIIGAVIGTRSVWDPRAPRPPSAMDVPAGASVEPPAGLTIAFGWTF
ncbi:MAG: hypothetical protein HQM12_07340 [SAR324 cluster bacterium]|nr:hypothetical protein [SAR324 cluster bacterium]MBF0351967.1 hypothetical protein [SAR324 cluster bacterium]